MPIYHIYCENCDRIFQGTVLNGSKPPEKWVCSNCEGDAEMMYDRPPIIHPLEEEHNGLCPCCR